MDSTANSSPIDYNLVIGTRTNCKRCGLERLDPIDRNGISPSGFKQWTSAQACGQCKRGDVLEYRPIYKGQNLTDVTNEMAREIWEQNLKQLQRQQREPKLESEFVNYAKLIFSANTIPITPDETDAFFVRLLIINFPNQFLGANANPNLIDELTTEQEMSALLSLVIRRIPRVLREGISYAGSHTIDENYLKYMRSSDPIRFFAERALKSDDTPNTYLLKTDAYDAYRTFCQENKLPVESSHTFSRKLKKLGYFDIQVRKGGKSAPKVWAWRNIKLIDWKKVEDEGQEVLDLG